MNIEHRLIPIDISIDQKVPSSNFMRAGSKSVIFLHTVPTHCMCVSPDLISMSLINKVVRIFFIMYI